MVYDLASGVIYYAKGSANANPKCQLSPVSTDVYTALPYNPTCQFEARQALIYQLRRKTTKSHWR